MPIAKHDAAAGGVAGFMQAGWPSGVPSHNPRPQALSIGVLVQSVADSLHPLRRPAGTVACDRLAGTTNFAGKEREIYDRHTLREWRGGDRSPSDALSRRRERRRKTLQKCIQALREL